MKKLILPLLLIWSISVQAQQLSGVLEEHNRPEMDVVIFPFGMESPI
jgi:hypothetical protein